jgi:hypothetical protein
VSDRFNVLRSWVRGAAKASADRLGKLESVANARQAISELRQRRASLSEGALSSAVARGAEVVASTASIRDGLIRLDLTYEDGEQRMFAVLPERVRFAPRGAKEVLFSIEPPELASDSRVREAVGCIAAAIARALWGPVLGQKRGDEQALTEREGSSIRTDLRSIPAVRAALEGSPLAMALEVITIEAFVLEDRRLRLKIGFPSLPFR